MTVLEQTSAYSTLARGGTRIDPWSIERIARPNGAEIDPRRPEPKRVLTRDEAMVLVDVLRQNVLAGTGRRADIGRDSAGKTGTTDDHSDAWYCGMTPTYTACVWMGYPDAMRPMRNVHGISVAGGTFPAEIWSKTLRPAHESTPLVSFGHAPRDFQPPESDFEPNAWRRDPLLERGNGRDAESDDDE